MLGAATSRRAGEFRCRQMIDAVMQIVRHGFVGDARKVDHRIALLQQGSPIERLG